MNLDKKGLPSQRLSCEICEIESMSNAEYALHEFTKKHCDNLIRSVKNKPILKKHKTKNKVPEVEKETLKVNIVKHAGSFAKYGYFIPGEIYVAAKDPKEFNTDYDPYLQKFPETHFKEIEKPLMVEKCQQQSTTGIPSAGSVSKKKKKKKSRNKMCQICKVTLLTTPLYEAHMKSPEHILKLKVSGMGVSAHFVKASSDLHTIEIKEDNKVNQDMISLNDKSNIQDSSLELSLSNCNTNELAASSSHQHTSHDTGKYVNALFDKKVPDKEILENSLADKLFCYTCNILLNTVFQYNEHKNGKKHKIKCRALIRNGMTVPPEERVPGIGLPNNNPSQPLYPELYMKMILERQKISAHPTVELSTGSSKMNPAVNISEQTKSLVNKTQVNNITENSGNDDVLAESQDEINCTSKVLENAYYHELVKPTETTFCKINFVSAKTDENPAQESNLEKSTVASEMFSTNTNKEVGHFDKEQEMNITVLNYEESLHCSICNENFQWQFQFDMHVTNEDHLKKIVELKVSGKSDHEILNLIFSDRNVVKPNNVGRLTCSICKVIADSKSEFEQHLNCVVHKYSEKDYKQKRTLEVKHLIPCDETGMYYCKLCKIKLTSLVEFSQHFFSAKHKSIQKRKSTSRSMGLSQRQRLSQNLKRKYILLQSLIADRNLGGRLRESGLAADLTAGAQAKVPNLEFFEPKTEPKNNVDIEPNGKSGILEAENNSNARKPQHLFKAGIKAQRHGLQQANSGPMPPSLLTLDFRPSTNFSRFPNRPPYGWYPSRARNVPPFFNSHPPAFEPFYGRPLMNNSFYGPPHFERNPWRNYR